MRKKILLLLMLVFMLSLLSACENAGVGGPEKVTEAYLQAIINADDERLSTLSCAEWEMNAIMELDSFQAVDARLEDMTCEQSGTDGDITLVSCEGKIVTTYNNESTEIPLNTRIFEMVNQGGEWLVCGYR